jgi:hypothetical protein
MQANGRKMVCEKGKGTWGSPLSLSSIEKKNEKKGVKRDPLE